MEQELTEKLQKVELDILCELDRLFKENNIKYFLAYGTTLGCVRHGGFIPWDDDVDIFIFGEDYPKVKELFEKHDTGFLELHDYETKENYPYVFPKVVDTRTELKECDYSHVPYTCGVYIDIFPLFCVSDNKLIKFFAEKLRYLRYAKLRLYYADVNRCGKLRKVLSKTIKFTVNPIKLQKKLYTTYTAPKKDTLKYAEPLIFSEKAYINSCHVVDSVELDFAGKKLPVPIQYREYLTDTYGDYMKLPPEDMRVSNHSFEYVTIKEENK